jgi:hypothetical protein
MSDEKYYEIVEKLNRTAFDAGRLEERAAIITKLDAIEGKSSWDFEEQIQQLIKELRRETK